MRFIVIGGVAVGAHGYVRAITADTNFGGLDIVQLAKGVPGYSQLDGDAVESDLLGIPVRVCSLTRLREMKQAQDRAQDRADLENFPPE